MSNLFLSQTIDASFEHYGNEIVGGIKDDDNNWNIKGHKSRIVKIDKETLSLFAKLYDDENTPYLEARLPTLHSVELISVLEKFANYPKRLIDKQKEYYSTEMWHETNAQKDETISKKTTFIENSKELILAGPYFYVSNPLYKTPKEICKESSHYNVLDLTAIENDYLPRTNYIPISNNYETKIPLINFKNKKKKITNFYRYFHRRRIGSANERTVIDSFPCSAWECILKL